MKHGHDNVRDYGAELLEQAFSHVSSEPVIFEDEEWYTPALITDLKVVGLWE